MDGAGWPLGLRRARPGLPRVHVRRGDPLAHGPPPPVRGPRDDRARPRERGEALEGSASGRPDRPRGRAAARGVRARTLRPDGGDPAPARRAARTVRRRGMRARPRPGRSRRFRPALPARSQPLPAGLALPLSTENSGRVPSGTSTSPPREMVRTSDRGVRTTSQGAHMANRLRALALALLWTSVRNASAQETPPPPKKDQDSLQQQLDDLSFRIETLEDELAKERASRSTAPQSASVFNPAITVFGNFLGRLDDQPVFLEDDPTMERVDDRWNLREVEVDFRAAIDPWAGGVVIASFESDAHGERPTGSG